MGVLTQIKFYQVQQMKTQELTLIGLFWTNKKGGIAAWGCLKKEKSPWIKRNLRLKIGQFLLEFGIARPQNHLR